jgi:hypothetical protein
VEHDGLSWGELGLGSKKFTVYLKNLFFVNKKFLRPTPALSRG